MLHFKLYPYTSLMHIALAAYTLSSVLSTPVPIAPDPAEAQYHGQEAGYNTNILPAYHDAQAHYANLYYIWHYPSHAAHRKLLLEHCFGAVTPADDQIISDNIDILAGINSYISTNDVSEPMSAANHEMMAHVWYDTNPRRITFTALFHEQTPETRAATILHESTHVLLDTHDIFLNHSPYTPYPAMPDQANPDEFMYGYEGAGLSILASNAPHVTKYNADAYAVAAILATRVIHLQGKDKIKTAIRAKWAFQTTSLALAAQARAHVAKSGKKGSSSGSSSSRAGQSSGSGTSKGKGRAGSSGWF